MCKRSDWMQGLLWAEEMAQQGEQQTAMQEIDFSLSIGSNTDFDKGAKDYFHNKQLGQTNDNNSL